MSQSEVETKPLQSRAQVQGSSGDMTPDYFTTVLSSTTEQKRKNIGNHSSTAGEDGVSSHGLGEDSDIM